MQSKEKNGSLRTKNGEKSKRSEKENKNGERVEEN